MTATEPLIFDKEKNEVKALIKDRERYFDFFDRITYHFDLNGIPFEEFQKFFLEQLLSSTKDMIKEYC